MWCFSLSVLSVIVSAEHVVFVSIFEICFVFEVIERFLFITGHNKCYSIIREHYLFDGPSDNVSSSASSMSSNGKQAVGHRIQWDVLFTSQ